MLKLVFAIVVFVEGVERVEKHNILMFTKE